MKAIFIAMGACGPEIRGGSAETEGGGAGEKLITKDGSVCCEGDGNNWVFSDLNLELNPPHDELMPLRGACRTDSVKISPLISIIIDLRKREGGVGAAVCSFSRYIDFS